MRGLHGNAVCGSNDWKDFEIDLLGLRGDDNMVGGWFGWGGVGWGGAVGY